MVVAKKLGKLEEKHIKKIFKYGSLTLVGT